MEDKKAPQTISSWLPRPFPWWLSVLLAIGSYCSLKYLIPTLTPSNTTLHNLVQAAPTFAPLATIPFLLLAAKQLYDTDIKEKPDPPDNNHPKKPEE